MPADHKKTHSVCRIKQEKRQNQQMESVYKPLRGQKYFLHVKPSEEESLTKQIKLYGGVTAAVLDQIHAVITDDVYYVKYSADCRRRSVTEAGVRRRTSSSPSASTPRTHGSLNACGSSASTKVGQTTSSLDGEQKYFSKMPSILRQAMDLQLKITTLYRFRQMLAEIDSKLNALNAKRKYKSSLTSPKSTLHYQQSRKNAKAHCTTLRSPYFKFEDRAKIYCPVYKHFNEGWPKITIRPGAKGCPFERKPRPILEENPSEVGDKSITKQACNARKTRRRDNSAYCDLCQCWADNVDLHIGGDMHKRNAFCSANYVQFDRLAAEGPSLNNILDQVLSDENVPENEVVIAETTIIQNDAEISKKEPKLIGNVGRASREEKHCVDISQRIANDASFSVEPSKNCQIPPLDSVSNRSSSPVFRGKSTTAKRRRRHTVANQGSDDSHNETEFCAADGLKNSSSSLKLTRKTDDQGTCFSLPCYVNLPGMFTAEAVQ